MADKTHHEITVATRRASARLEVNPPILVDLEAFKPCFVTIIEIEYEETADKDTRSKPQRIKVGGLNAKMNGTPGLQTDAPNKHMDIFFTPDGQRT